MLSAEELTPTASTWNCRDAGCEARSDASLAELSLIHRAVDEAAAAAGISQRVLPEGNLLGTRTTAIILALAKKALPLLSATNLDYQTVRAMAQYNDNVILATMEVTRDVAKTISALQTMKWAFLTRKSFFSRHKLSIGLATAGVALIGAGLVIRRRRHS